MSAAALHIDRRVLACVLADDVLSAREFLAGLPPAYPDRSQVRFLLLCDEPERLTVEEIQHEFAHCDIESVQLLPLPPSMPWGARCKIGLRMAVERGFDAAVVLRSDARPELLIELIQALDESECDVVVSAEAAGSRRFSWDQLSAAVLNRATGLRLDSYGHDGRAYSTAFLQRVPFDLNSEDSFFDVEILLQAAHVKAAIASVRPQDNIQTGQVTARLRSPLPRPRGRGDRISNLRAAAAALQYRLHHCGMWCSLKLRHLGVERYQDKTQAAYTTHALAVEEVRRRAARTVLDIGCGPGFVAAACGSQGAQVTGVDSCAAPETPLHAFHRLDLERDPLPCSPYDFDATLMLDVIEHLANPEQFLLALRNSPRVMGVSRPVLILSTPNVAFATVRLGLLCGRFNYAERGILDITHKRLFTRTSLLRLLRDCGYDVESIRPVGAPFPAVMPGRIGRILGWCSDLLARLWPSLFAFQFLVIARPQPGMFHWLSRSTPLAKPEFALEALSAAAVLTDAHPR
jgi:2-polyprenyl-3-methyl-5-hydroxy-6-metoxy-1,4-benzoquinol methylase